MLISPKYVVINNTDRDLFIQTVKLHIYQQIFANENKFLEVNSLDSPKEFTITLEDHYLTSCAI